MMKSKIIVIRCYDEMDEEVFENEPNESEMEQDEQNDDEDNTQALLINDLEKQYKDLVNIFNSQHPMKY